MSERTDLELVAEALQGQADAVAELYRRYWRAARAVAYGATADLTAAEDAAAEALHKALTTLHKLDDPARLGPWLRTIVRRTARRQRPRPVNWEHLPAASAEPAPQERIEQRELAALVREAVDRLPDQLREAISLHYFEGYPVEEGARFLGIPTGTLKRRLYDGRQRLKHTCTAILQGRRPMSADRDRLAERIDAVLGEGVDKAAFLELAREIMRFRPVPRDLMHKLIRGHLGPRLSGEHWERIRPGLFQAMREYGKPSARTTDPNHPVGQVVNAIMAALPDFQRWEVTPEEGLESFIARYGADAPPEAAPLLPPGFAEGRPGAYLRLATGLVFVDENGVTADLGQVLHGQDAPDATNRRPEREARLSDVVDLMWLETRRIELREVEACLRDLAAKVMTTASVRFGSCEPLPYRAGLRMHLADCVNPAATGGVLQPWPGMVAQTDAVHVRLHLETWASALSGEQVEFRGMPALAFLSGEPEGSGD